MRCNGGRVDAKTNAAARRARAARPSPRVGQVIVFDEPLSVADGRSFQRLEVIANPRSHRTVFFRAPGSSSLGTVRLAGVRAGC